MTQQSVTDDSSEEGTDARHALEHLNDLKDITSLQPVGSPENVEELLRQAANYLYNQEAFKELSFFNLLEYGGLTEESIHLAARLCRGSYVETLFIYSSLEEESAMKYLGLCLHDNPNLKLLDLTYLVVTEDSFETFCRGLSTSKLEELHLNDMVGISKSRVGNDLSDDLDGSTFLKCLTRSLAVNRTVKKLHIVNNDFGDHHMDDIIALIEHSKSLTELVIGEDKFTDTSAQQLIDFIKSTSHGPKISVRRRYSNTNLSDEMAKQLEQF